MKPEILSPAGDFEKLRAAVLFGADAVYLAGRRFGMRASSSNFTDDELKSAVEFAHAAGVKIYVTVNIMPRTGEYAELELYLRYLESICVDAVIVSDIGVVMCVKRCAPSLEIHISTQASAVSAADCVAWHTLGAKRIVLARELSLDEVRVIRQSIPDEIELECFVHGSMCVAYSGRCLLSQHFVGRDANRGMCAQPCRWNYTASGRTLEFEEEKRHGEVLTAVEDGGDTFIMASKDMCMIDHIPELCDAGITSFKIEGRVRSAYYTAVVTNTYKMAVDRYMSSPEAYKFDPAWQRELDCVSHREYGTGFFFTSPHEDANLVTIPGYIREKAYLATALTDSTDDGNVTFVQRNKVIAGSAAELLTPGKTGISFTVGDLYNEGGEKVESAPHPGMIFTTKMPVKVHRGDIMRGGDTESRGGTRPF